VRGFTGELYRRFVRELPWLIGIWALVAMGLAAWGVISGERDLGQSLAVALTFLPLAVPLSPLMWLRFESRAWTPRAFPAIGLAGLWFVVTMPLAVAASVLLGSLFSVE
jgi:hypothetical protein